MNARYPREAPMTIAIMRLKGMKSVFQFRSARNQCTREIAEGALAQEAALVAAAQAKPEAFVPLYRRYLPPIYRYCYVRMGSREAAEDATSEAFLKALANLKSFRGGCFAAWLFRIAHNVVADHWRQRRPNLPLDSAANELDPAPALEDLVEARVERQQFQAALDALTDDRRRVIELTLAGWSGREIGWALNKTPAAVKAERYRALNQVREFLKQNRLEGSGGAR
jgi:RNA polymerase sigma-70 factor, ECF subfamily